MKCCGKWYWCVLGLCIAGALGYFGLRGKRSTDNPSSADSRPLSETTETGAFFPTRAKKAVASKTNAVLRAAPVAAAETGWRALATDTPFARFAEWAERYAGAEAAAQRAMEAEGLALAVERRRAMKSLIVENPKRALDLAVPKHLRKDLPQSVQASLEEHVSARGNYEVLAAVPLPGEKLGVPAVQRSIRVGDRTYDAFVYGHRVDAPTKRNIPLRGIALEQSMAVHEDPVRVLSAEELAQVQAATPAAVPLADEAICGVSGLAATTVNEPVAAEVADEIVWLCRYAHAELMNEQLRRAAHKLGRADGSDPLDGEMMESPYTEGRKRLIMIRVAFSNLPTPDISSNQLVTVHAAMDTYWRITSYGRTSAAELQRGSDIVQVTLANTYQTYDDRAGPFRDDVRAAATAAGIDLAKYDFDVVYSGGGRPAFSFGGLGYVGAPGSWVVGASRGITAHELGHNLGFPHANFWDTGGQSAIGPGGNQEYGDPFDVMGGGGIDDGTGPGHYVSKFKWRIGWIPDTDFPRITSSGTYRIYAHDNPESRGLRGVRFRRDAALDYYLEFRQRYTSLPYMVNGIGLRWGSTGGSSSQLIDTTPGTGDGKNDSAIVIGRTFSDPTAPVHITPLGLAGTYPPSIDVRVNIGAFPGNQPPVLTLLPSTLTSSVGGPVTFTARASDPNNDALAYWWDFGDGTFSPANSPVVTNAFRTAGEYVVRCVVSDMKGGTASESTLIHIGRPVSAIHGIRGRVLFNGQPVPHVLVRASATRFAYTDSDGTYEISRLTAGSYNVSAQLDPYTFIHPFFNNPVTVGPADAENIDFVRVIAPQNNVFVVASNAVWKYLDDGSDQGMNWSQTSFDDSTWRSGPAELGYGDGDEATTLSYGPDSANKYITYYFRRLVHIPDPGALTNFVLSFLRDDGGIVYVNGTEVLRDNMPDNGVTYLTTALGSSEEATAVTVIDPALLVPGTNLIAAEVHQSDGGSSDVSFNLWVTATTATNFSGINAFYIARPGQNDSFTLPGDVTITANAFSSDDTYTLVEFLANGTKVGEDNSGPFEFTYASPPAGIHSLTAIATLSSGARLTSAVVDISVVAPSTQMTLIESNASWLYHDLAQDLGTGWREPAYDDSLWASGPAPLGFGDPGFNTTLQPGPSSARTPTFYFRRSFTLEDAALVTNLVATLYRDDGVVLYLNGIEAARVLMPNGPIGFHSLASGGVDSTDETTPVILNLPAGLLLDGTNVLAAEVHQQSPTSSDARFGLEIIAAVSGAPTPGVRISTPLAGANFTAGDAVGIAATAVGSALTSVEFYRDGSLLGADTTVPYTLSWLEPRAGAYVLTAVAHEVAGGSYTSAPVAVTISAPRVERQLISPRSLWRYLDDGSDPGTAWAQRFFNDSGWPQGFARLGYGGDGESTTVSYGPDPSRRFITTYFRHAFAVSNVAGIAGLKLQLARDDGAVVYLNGAEIYRNNMRPGTVSYNSLAIAAVDTPEETNFVAVNVSANTLLVGNNVLAVEIHQDNPQSPDLGFDLALVAESATNIVEAVYMASPGEGARVTLPATVELRAFAMASAPIHRVQFLVNGVPVAEDATFPYNASWEPAALGIHVLTAVAHLEGGTQLASPAVNIQVQGPPVPVTQVLSAYISSGASWRYWPSAASPPADWNANGYNDASWPEGNARLGFGLDGEATTLPSGRMAYYFRRTIHVANPALIDELIFQLQRDDGAVVYLNGVEVFRSNMPAGLITSTTPASADATGLDEQQFFITSVPANGLKSGANVVAVEVHQSNLTSSDVGFDMHLTGSGDTSPRILIGQPGAGTQFVVGTPVVIQAHAWPGQGRHAARIELLINGVLLAEFNSPPYVFDWSAASQGSYTLAARMTDNFGETVTSRSINFSVGYEVVRTNFIPAGAVWKYLDNGSNQGTNFAQFSYNDSTWASGPAQLGYGDGDESTTVSYGGSSSAKYITTYFRRGFQVPAGWTMTNLTFRLLRDDGAVVWFNGRELYRSNMPTGPITSTTVAAARVDDPEEDAYFATSFTMTGLPATNLIAVEIHQREPGSSDISFDLEVAGTGYIATSAPPVLNITRGAAGELRLTWPSIFADWRLFSSSEVTAGWTLSGSSVTQSNNQNVVVMPASSGSEFFQLRRQ